MVDCGRWATNSPAQDLIADGDALLVVLRPTLEGVDMSAAASTRCGLPASRPSVLSWSVTAPTNPPRSKRSRIPVAGVLPYDARGARALERRMIGADTMRSTIVRAARSALDRMAGWPSIRSAVWA